MRGGTGGGEVELSELVAPRSGRGGASLTSGTTGAVLLLGGIGGGFAPLGEVTEAVASSTPLDDGAGLDKRRSALGPALARPGPPRLVTRGLVFSISSVTLALRT